MVYHYLPAFLIVSTTMLLADASYADAWRANNPGLPPSYEYSKGPILYEVFDRSDKSSGAISQDENLKLPAKTAALQKLSYQVAPSNFPTPPRYDDIVDVPGSSPIMVGEFSPRDFGPMSKFFYAPVFYRNQPRSVIDANSPYLQRLGDPSTPAAGAPVISPQRQLVSYLPSTEFIEERFLARSNEARIRELESLAARFLLEGSNPHATKKSEKPSEKLPTFHESKGSFTERNVSDKKSDNTSSKPPRRVLNSPELEEVLERRTSAFSNIQENPQIAFHDLHMGKIRGDSNSSESAPQAQARQFGDVYGVKYNESKVTSSTGNEFRHKIRHHHGEWLLKLAERARDNSTR